MLLRRPKSDPQITLIDPTPPRRRGRPRRPGGPRHVPHRPRPHHDRGHPVHITMRAARDLPSLRDWRPSEAIEQAIARGHKTGFRVIHYSIQPDHLHLVVEGEGRRTLMRGAQGLAIRIARRVNERLGRRGRVFQERYHARALGTPLEVRRALAYVLLNFKKHVASARDVDPLSSARWFTGWARPPRIRDAHRPHEGRPVVRAPCTWLAARGWKRHGLVHFDERPA